MHAKTSLCACVHVACTLVTMCAICQALFFAFTLPLKTQQFKILKKWRKKKCWRYHYFTQVFQKPQSYEVQFLRYRVRKTEFFILGHFFCHFTPLKSKFYKNQNKKFTKIKKAHGDAIILHTCTKNYSYMMYASWDMEYDTQFFVILGHFLPFYPTIDPKNKNLELI